MSRRVSASKILLVTYTMEQPAVVGVFFRALRLGFDLRQRGHSVTVANCGRIPRDPKVQAARRELSIHEIPWVDETFDLSAAVARLAAFEPDLVVFGEGPFDTMQTVFRATKRLGTPFILLDQYYQDWLVKRHDDVDLVLLYGLDPFIHPGEFEFGDSYRLTPPFIGEVTPREQLPLPAALHPRPWVTVLGFDDGVLEAGIDRVADLQTPRPVLITVSHDPKQAEHLWTRRGLTDADAVALGLLADSDLFGLMAASRAVILANGYMQILESVALATPALCMNRGVGLEAWTVEKRFQPYVSIGESVAVQCQRLDAWLRASPFSPQLATQLAGQRHGARHCADQVEDLLLAAETPAVRQRIQQRVEQSYHQEDAAPELDELGGR